MGAGIGDPPGNPAVVSGSNQPNQDAGGERYRPYGSWGVAG